MITSEDAVTESMDPIALAKLFIGGRNLRRGTTIELVRALLHMVHPVAAQSATMPSPVTVHKGTAGSIRLGMEAARFYSPTEAAALAAEIIHQTECGRTPITTVP